MPRGRVVTRAGGGGAGGAVGGAGGGVALRALPHDTDTPWWRVINAKGGISLRGRGHGADLQRELLEEEGVVFDDADTVDLRVYRWWPDEESGGQGPA